MVKDLLVNPVYYALGSGDRQLGVEAAGVRYFPEPVSPFAGFSEDNRHGFETLYDILPAGRRILYALPYKIQAHGGWLLQHEIGGLQFVFTGNLTEARGITVTPLAEEHIDEMIALVQLTRPGPFGKQTIRFGHYFGIFKEGRLVAMTGQRLHVEDNTEISAVCTHPDYLGKGYAAELIRHQLQIILSHGEQPFLHVRDNNERAIALYHRLGFKISRPMNFYFLKRS